MSEQPISNLIRTARSESATVDVMVVGGGIAGSTVAAVLAQAGMVVSVFDPSFTHGQHTAAALTPVISSDDNVRARLSRLGATLAAQWWQQFDDRVVTPCGAIQLQRPEGARRVVDLKAQAHAFAQPGWARWVERDEASDLAGLELPRGGIWYPGGWLVRVPKLIDVQQSMSQVMVHRTAIERVQATPEGWLAFDPFDVQVGQARTLVLANAFDCLGLMVRSGLTEALNACDRLPAMHRLAGEVTGLPAAALKGGPKCIVGGDGYVLPAVDGWCVSGGTYVRQASHAVCSEAGRLANVTRASDLLGMPVAVSDSASLPGWAGWRAVLPGRLPAIGAVPNARGLWVHAAGASRGLTWAVLGAMLIRDQISGRMDSWDALMVETIRP